MTSTAPPRVQSFTIDQLRLSPHNVRKHRPDAEATSALEASILAEGRLLEPILVHAMRGNSRTWGVFAGGRRYRSIRNLVDRGALPADWPIPGIIHEASDVELVARSLDENLLRRDLQEYEICAAYVREKHLGRGPEEIARRHGQELGDVKRLLRLGELAPALLEAYAAGLISPAQARAYGATADHARQLAAYEAMCARPENGRTPAAIRAWMRVDDREAARLLRFVGEEAYTQAGGTFERDLFAEAEDMSGIVTDDALLRRLADEKIVALKAATRERVRRPDLRFAAAAPQGAYGPDWALALQPDALPPAGDVMAVIAIGDDGEPDITYWWGSRKAMEAERAPRPAPAKRAAASVISIDRGAAIGAHQYDGARQKADALIKEEAGLTAEGTKILRSIRRGVLRAILIDDARRGGSVGLDYLVWAQLRLHLSRAGRHGMAERGVELGIARISGAEPDIEAALAHLDGEAGKAWDWALRDLQTRVFLAAADPVAAFLDYREAPVDVKRLAAAVVASLALEPSLAAEGYRVPLHDAVAAEARGAHPQAMRHWWQPTAAFLDLLPTAERRAIAEPFVPRETFASWLKLKSGELTRLVLRTLTTGAPSATKPQQLAAKAWVHPLLAFERGPRPLAEVFAEQADQSELEAAE